LIRRGDQHASQIQAISITQPTELGTVYTPEEIKALSQFAHSERLFLHMDGARLVNAAASLGVSFKALTTDCGVDALSLGGTKNGLLYGEAVLFLRPGLSEHCKFQRKQMMQLPSKTRFIAAQFMEFLGTELWLKNATHANAMAQLLYNGLCKSPFAEVTQVPQANAVFARIPRYLVAKLREVAFFYVWNEQSFECRLMTTWDTQAEEIERFLQALNRLGHELKPS
jgi:threonine aldolase